MATLPSLPNPSTDRNAWSNSVLELKLLVDLYGRVFVPEAHREPVPLVRSLAVREALLAANQDVNARVALSIEER